MAREDLYNYIHAYTWYFEQDETAAEELLMNKLNQVAARQARVADNLLKHLQSKV